MKDKTLRKLCACVLAAAGLAPALQSCNIEDLTGSLTKGQEENITIANKNYGELHVDEPYADAVACFDVVEHPTIEQIEMTADGRYHITYRTDTPMYYDAQEVPQTTLDMRADGRHMRLTLPMQAGRAQATRTGEYASETGSFSYDRETGEYVLTDLGWRIIDGQLVIYHDGTETERYEMSAHVFGVADALTDRLCHTWALDEVLVKVYRIDDEKPGQKDKLLITYRLTDEDRYEYCVDTFYFTRFHKFHRYMHGENNGNGEWRWIDAGDQSLHYEFTYFSRQNPIPMYGENDLGVYFSNNFLYMTEESEALAEDYDDDDDDFTVGKGKTIRVRAELLYQLRVTEK